MINTIWKYTLFITDESYLEMADHADILSVQVQDGMVTMWAMVDTEEPTIQRRYRVIGTGNPMPPMDGFFYAGTVQDVPVPGLVWHYFFEE